MEEKTVESIVNEGNAYACIQCGKCTGSCPSGMKEMHMLAYSAASVLGHVLQEGNAA